MCEGKGGGKLWIVVGEEETTPGGSVEVNKGKGRGREEKYRIG